jgi:tetratricopeptide (TPR) repeat protein
MTSMTISLPRRRPRTIGILAAAAIIVVGSYAVAALRPAADPIAQPVPGGGAGVGSVEPASPGAVEPARIDGGGAPIGSLAQIDHSIEAWSRNLAGNPSDFLAATNLATLYHGRGRLSNDLADYDRALAAARTALGIEASHAPARAIEAAVLVSLHDFDGAFSAADSLVRDDPSQVGALATRFDAAVEMGRLDEARIDLERLRALGGPAVLIREARLASVTGDPAAALDRARAAQAAAIADDAEDLGFYAYAVGEYARLAGDADTARAGYADALDSRDDDLGALTGLARIDAFDGRVAAAIDGLRRATDIAPQPEALALLGDLLATSGTPGADETYDTIRFIERLGDLQAVTYDRQVLGFELDHGGASSDLLTRARASLAERPDWSAHDIVAWALYRLGRFDEAAEEIAAARALGADGARLRFHEGAIAIARGDRTAGAVLLRSALDLGPALDPIERVEATRLLGL